ncbi:MAG: hypothetical protein JST22_09525 [Bacteroidetes bacterium]|nr:hypothetical protein [Bacteroidota bacterium]
MTSKGVVNVMMVFVDFPDDPMTAEDSTLWPVGAGPTFMQDIVDASPNIPSGKKFNITTYFRDASFGQFVVIGHPFYVQAPKPLWRYQQNLKNDGSKEADSQAANVPYYVNRDVLQILDSRLDSNDWKEYDTWSFRKGGNYIHQQVPDGVIDMIIMCYRNYPRLPNNGFIGEGFNDLGGVNSAMTMSVGKGAEHIKFGPRGNGGSGITCFDSRKSRRIDIYIHEMGHFLLGSYERYNGVNEGLWSLEGESHYVNVSLFMNAQERYQLGWMDYVDVSHVADGTTAQIPDFGTTGVAYRYAPVLPDFEDFILENHQGLPSHYIMDSQGGSSSYDVVDWTGAPGLYIIETRRYNPRVVCADGRWNWNQDSLRVSDPSYAPFMQPVFRRGSIDRINGTTDRQPVNNYHRGPLPGEGWYSDAIYSWFDEETGALRLNSREFTSDRPRHKGDGHDRWSADENNIFSPWSNPTTHMSEDPRNATTFGLEVLPSSGTDVSVRFYTVHPENAPPSRPQDPHTTLTLPDVSGNLHPRLTWELNIEPDMQPGGTYEIWRCDSAPACSWILVTTVNGDVGEYTDLSVSIPDGQPQEGRTIRYKLRARDTQGLFSSYSEERIVVISAPILRLSPNPGSNTIPSMHDAIAGRVVPNPASSNARFIFTLPSDDRIMLELYDGRGALIATLLDREMARGSYEADLSLSGLPPGIYTLLLRDSTRSCLERLVVNG